MCDDRLRAEIRLSEVRNAGGTMRDLVREVALISGGLAYLLDPDERIVASYAPPGAESPSIPRLARLLTAIGSVGEPPVSAVPVPDDPRHLAPRRHILAPVRHAGSLFGYLVVAIGRDDVTDLDPVWLADRAVAHLRGEFLAQRRLARVAWNARANLGRQMIRGTTYDADLRACAEYLGVDIDADRVVVFILERGRPSGSTVDAGRLAEMMEAELGVEILPIRGSEGGLLAVKVEAGTTHGPLLQRIKGAVVRGLEKMGDEQAVAGLSSVTRAGLLRRAYREAREVARCIDRYGSPETRAVGCDELGPARLFVANSDEHSVRLYVHDVLGPLLDGSEAMRVLLQTLQTFFESGRSIRESATILAVHENTVRHRLSKVHELTGLDVASTSNDQLSIQTALLVLKLQGHRALVGFGRGTAEVRQGAPA
jgi:sugar diacid utilization regulator